MNFFFPLLLLQTPNQRIHNKYTLICDFFLHFYHEAKKKKTKSRFNNRQSHTCKQAKDIPKCVYDFLFCLFILNFKNYLQHQQRVLLLLLMMAMTVKEYEEKELTKLKRKQRIWFCTVRIIFVCIYSICTDIYRCTVYKKKKKRDVKKKHSFLVLCLHCAFTLQHTV